MHKLVTSAAISTDVACAQMLMLSDQAHGAAAGHGGREGKARGNHVSRHAIAGLQQRTNHSGAAVAGLLVSSKLHVFCTHRSSGNAGGFWQSGATGLLRTNFRAKQAGGPAAALPVPGAAAGTKAAASSSGPPSRTSSASASRTEAVGRAPGSVSAAESSSAQRSGRPPGSLPPAAPKAAQDVAVVGSATARRAPADVLSVHHDKVWQTGRIGCGGMVVVHCPQGLIITLGHVDAYRHRLEGLRAVPMTMMT